MPFRFPLHAVLRMRESLEKAELQKLRICAAEVTGVRAEIESLNAEITSAQRALSEQTVEGISGAELQWGTVTDELRKEKLTRLQAKLNDLELARRKQQQKYGEARRQREILSNLRDREYSAYQLEMSKREQQQIDELFLIRGSVGRPSRSLDEENEP